VVSHELRTPLTSIHGSLGLVIRGIAGALTPETRQLLDVAYRNSQRLVRLVSDILDLQKIESGTMAFEMKPLELTGFLQHAVEANQAYAAQFGVRFVLERPTESLLVLADGDRLMQVLTNLLSNAAKFSPRGEAVVITASPAGGVARVSVVDRGPGIPAEFHDRIFNRFAQADSSTTRDKGGTGLGLSISKAIVERLGGSIGFESRRGQGTTFYFDLPEHRVASGPAGAIGASPWRAR
jgi:signal transduction histidine kinase